MAEEVKTEEVVVEENVDSGGTTKKEPSPVPYSKFRSEYMSRKKAEDKAATLEAELAVVQEEIGSYKLKVKEYKGYKTKIEQWENDRLTEKKQTWAEKAKIFDVNEGDKTFEKINKIKDDFTWGTEDKPLTSEQIDENFKLFKIYEKAEYFGTPKVEDKTDKSKPNTEANVKDTEEFYGYKSLVELASKEPEKYVQWKKENLR